MNGTVRWIASVGPLKLRRSEFQAQSKVEIPEAKSKPAKDLLEHEKTLYYERLAFLMEIPSMSAIVDGKLLNLTIGGVKAYNQDNLNGKQGTLQRFKVFVGFKNLVCTNLCIWSDGFTADLRVRDLDDLGQMIYKLFSQYDANTQISQMQKWEDYFLTEQQFAQLLGRCRMYHHLPKHKQQRLPRLYISDSQIGAVARQYYSGPFRATDEGIDLWKLYNLFTGAVKSSYIDTFLDRNANAHTLVEKIQASLDGTYSNWFLE